MDKKQNLNYEELYDRLFSRAEALHSMNQKRIRAGLIFLIVFSIVMILVRWLTDSDRVVFLVLWVVGMFAASIYLISIEYIDSSVQKTIEEVTEQEAEFGELLPDSEAVRRLVRGRIQERQEEIQSRYHALRKESGSGRSGEEVPEEAAGAEGPAGDTAAEEGGAE